MPRRDRDQQAKVENLFREGQNIAAAASSNINTEDSGGSEEGKLANLNGQRVQVGVTFPFNRLPGERAEYIISVDNVKG